MNERLAKAIFSIVQKLSKVETDKFIEQNKKKSKGSEKEYIKLFREYVRQKEIDDYEPNKETLKIKFPNVNDTNQELIKKLLAFILQEFQNKENEVESIEKLKDKLILGKALMEKGLFSLAEEEIKYAFYLAKKLYSNTQVNRSAISGYLTELFFILYELNIKNASGNLWATEEELYKNIIEPITKFMYSHYSDIRFNEKDEKWNQYVYYEVLRIYYREKKEYNQLINLNKTEKPSRRNIGIFNNDINHENILIQDYIFMFEIMYASLKVKDYNSFYNSHNEVKNALANMEMTAFNTYFIIFCYRELYRLIFIYSAKENGNITLLNDLKNDTHNRLNLFTDQEINNSALQIYINDLIIKFLKEEHYEFIKKFEKEDFQKMLKNFQDYYCPLKIMLLFSYGITNYSRNNKRERKALPLEDRDVLENEILRLIPKIKGEVFYKKLIPYLKNTYSLYDKSIYKEEFEELEQLANEQDHFHQIILKVIKRYVKDR